jgi:uncharacterized membrane protein YhaH (DUF805 family)
MLGAIRHGLANLLRFSGRDARTQFWLYAAFVYLVAQAVTMLAMAPAMARMFTMSIEQGQRAGAAGPDAIGRTMQENLAATFSMMSDILYVTVAIGVLAVLLLAAAVARRLHDSGRSGAWGLVPLPFLLAGFILMHRFFAAIGRPGFEADPLNQGAFMMMMANNLIYLCLLVLLIVLLAQAGTPGENRYGPPPAPAADPA